MLSIDRAIRAQVDSSRLRLCDCAYVTSGMDDGRRSLSCRELTPLVILLYCSITCILKSKQASRK